MTKPYFTRTTRAQREACFKLYERSLHSKRESYLSFRRNASYDHLLGVLMVPFCGMWVGIEHDGYTHS